MTISNQMDLELDLNSEDESGLPWGFIDAAKNSALLSEGQWIIVGQGSVKAVAQIIEIEDDIVRVRPYPGP